MELNETEDPASRSSSTASSGNTFRWNSNNARERRQYGSPAASLIQSAARSMLDDATPDTAVSGLSDDESDPSSVADGKLGNLRSVTAPMLSSLEHMKELPAIPDEQDRRRFLVRFFIVQMSSSPTSLIFQLLIYLKGCLAAILASNYDYDEQDENITSVELAKETFAYLDYTEELYGDEDVDGQQEVMDRGDLARADSFPNTRSQSFESIETQDSSDSQPTPRRRRQKSDLRTRHGATLSEKAKLSAQRHRKRRYEISCKFLMASSELLLLDKSVAKGFLPMLGRVLVPPKRHSANNRSTRPPLHGRGLSSQSSQPTAEENRSPLKIISAVLGQGKLEQSKDSKKNTKMGQEYIPEEVDKDDLLRPFLESLTPGCGFRCLSLLLLQHLLTSEVGYDSRIRHVLQKVGVIVLVHDMERDPVERELLPGKAQPDTDSYSEMAAHAARKFESLEHSIARRLIRLSESNRDKKSKGSRGIGEKVVPTDTGITREQIVRGVKIGSAGLVAGTLFALTGGLAAPGIAAGVAAMAGSTAVASAAVGLLSSTAVVTTIFGVGGGSLAAFKMQRRTQGLTEFEIRKEAQYGAENEKCEIDAELFSTICISGWLRDKYDFQRPWGLHPTNPRLYNRLELLERFYSIHSPDHVPKCEKILGSWEGEERQLWAILHEKYGCTPDHLFPLGDGPRIRGTLSLEQEEVLDQIFVDLGYNSAAPKQHCIDEKQPTPLERMREGWGARRKQQSRVRSKNEDQKSYHRYNSTEGPSFGMSVPNGSKFEGSEESQETAYKPPKHLSTVWDYTSEYGGELYTVRWESELLKTICDCVMDLAMDVVTGATRQILKQTVLHALLSAVVWPSYLLNVANMIDGEWTLAVERADQAGRELARSLLFSRAGRRPVVLIGFSFGARVIYACLKELARMQEDWEDYQELRQEEDSNSREEKLRLAKLNRKFDGMREPASVVEDAIIMGLPNHLSLSSWKACRQVVAGRLVNCFSTKDLILSLMFQAKRSSLGSFNPSQGVGSILKPVCGTCPVPVSGVENIDISDLVSGHEDYCLVTGRILKRVRHGQPLKHVSTSPVEALIEPIEAKKITF
eukprot:scaffold721_cov131-Cylindrotheca_fusiformis.AAC.41